MDDTRKTKNQVSVWAYAYKKGLLAHPGFHNHMKVFHEDPYWNAVLMSLRPTVLITDETFYSYRLGNVGSICHQSKKLSPFQRLKLFNEWFVAFENCNIDNCSDLRDYWLYLFVYNAIGQFNGFRKAIALFEADGAAHPDLREIKSFFKRHRPYRGVRKAFVKLCLAGKFFDVFLTKLYMIKSSKRRIKI